MGGLMLTTAPLALRPPGPCHLGCPLSSPLVSSPTLRPHLAAFSVAFLVFGAASSRLLAWAPPLLVSLSCASSCAAICTSACLCSGFPSFQPGASLGSSWPSALLSGSTLPLFCVCLLGQTDVPTELVSGPLSSPYTPNVNILRVSNLISHGSLHPVMPKSQL